MTSGYAVLPSSISEDIAYREAHDQGKTLTETSKKARHAVAGPFASVCVPDDCHVAREGEEARAEISGGTDERLLHFKCLPADEFSQVPVDSHELCGELPARRDRRGGRYRC